MRAPPLRRSFGHSLRGRLQLAAASPVQHALMRSQQARSNSSESNHPPTPYKTVDATTAEPPIPPSPQNPAEPTDEEIQEHLPRYPRSLQAYNLQPLRRQDVYGIPSCDVQMRSYNARPLEYFCDFALRAAYYLKLPAFGPVPLPRLTERWTVPRSPFIHKKSQENFERITLRRLIQIRDGHPETVQVWLAFLQKHAWPGVGLKANMWEFGALDAAKEMDEAAKRAEGELESKWAYLGQGKSLGTVEDVERILTAERMRIAGGR